MNISQRRLRPTVTHLQHFSSTSILKNLYSFISYFRIKNVEIQCLYSQNEAHAKLFKNSSKFTKIQKLRATSYSLSSIWKSCQCLYTVKPPVMLAQHIRLIKENVLTIQKYFQQIHNLVRKSVQIWQFYNNYADVTVKPPLICVV